MKKFFLMLSAALIGIASAYAYGEITTLPEGGTTVKYERTSRSYYPYDGAPMANDDASGVAELTYYDNGDVYFYEPFVPLKTNAYIKGYVDGDRIVFPLNVPFYTLDIAGYEIDCYASRMVYRSEFKAMKPADDQNLVFNVLSDGSLCMEGYKPTVLEDVVMLGLVDEYGFWRSYGEQNIYMTPMDRPTPVTIPETATVEDWTLINFAINQDVKVAFDGNDVYISDFFDGIPGCTIKGEIKGDKITFADGQYVGEYDRHFVYFIAVDVESIYDPTYGQYLSQVVRLDELTFQYNPEMKTMSSKEIFMLNAGLDKILEVYTIDSPFLKVADEELPLTKLQDPQILAYWPNQYWVEDDLDHGTIIFSIPLFDENYNYLDTDNLYYEIFFDNDTEPYEFTPPTYPNLTKGISQMPWGFTEGRNFATDSNQYHYVYFHRDCDRMGVRLVYYGEDGGVYYSTTVYNDGSTVGVEKVEVEKSVAAVVYYDLAGRRVVNPENGIFIQLTRFTDGSAKSSKIRK